MSKNNSPLIIRKIPLEIFITLLSKIYLDGANYVDIYGEVDDKGIQDKVSVEVREEYLQPDPPPGLPPEETEEEEEEKMQDEFEFMFFDSKDAQRKLSIEQIENIIKNGMF